MSAWHRKNSACLAPQHAQRIARALFCLDSIAIQGVSSTVMVCVGHRSHAAWLIGTVLPAILMSVKDALRVLNATPNLHSGETFTGTLFGIEDSIICFFFLKKSIFVDHQYQYHFIKFVLDLQTVQESL